MCRVLPWLLLGLIACRWDFDLLPEPPVTPDALAALAPGDAPPTPSVICGISRIALDTIPAAADLAIGPTTEGYAAIWSDTARAAAAHAALLTPSHALTRTFAISTVTDSAIGGITDVGSAVALATATGTTETEWILGRDLSPVAGVLPIARPGHVMARSPFPSNMTPTRGYVTAQGTNVVSSYIAGDGQINPAIQQFGTTGPITALACADGPGHAHCAYTEALTTAGGASQCTATDVLFTANAPSVAGGHVTMSGDCYDARTSTGPYAADSMLVVWTTSGKRVEARYIGAAALDKSREIALAGSAPKVQFDGTRFWIAWLDGAGALMLTAFQTDASIASYSLAGWTPRGPEAFELVHRDGPSETGLVLLSAGELDFLTICP